MKKRGFTLIELLVVIAIIGILAVIIILNLAAASEKSRYAKVKSELKNIDDAVTISYTDGVQLVEKQNPTKLTDGSVGFDYKTIVDKGGNRLFSALPTPPDTFNRTNYRVIIRGVSQHAALLETSADSEGSSGEWCAYSSGAFITGVVVGSSTTADETYCDPR